MAARSAEDVADAVRAADSEALLRELERRGMGDFSSDTRQSHVVGSLRKAPADTEARAAELKAALAALDVDVEALLAGPPLKAYNTYVRPRDQNGSQQTAANAAQQIAFLQRHERARREEHLRNTDAASRARRAAGLVPHSIDIVLDNVRSAENVGSIFRTADCARCRSVLTAGFTPNPISTSKLAKTAFGAEAAVATRHFDTTRAALLDLRSRGVSVWALETHDSASSHVSASLPPLSLSAPDTGGVALLLGNEVTGVDMDLLPLVDNIVEIPTFGTKNSMNVAVAAGIVLFDILRRWDVLR